LWLLLLRAQSYSPVLRYFLVLSMAGNLFGATGYFLFSGVANFGDWAAVIAGVEPHWLWRVLLIAVRAASYYASMLLVAAKLPAFRGPEESPRELRAVCWIPYFTDGVLAGVAGLFNPAGLFYVIASTLPSTLGANAGLWSLPSMVCSAKNGEEPVRIPRCVTWIACAAVASLLFIFVLGRGVTWSR
jgi:hypothetical protein